MVPRDAFITGVSGFIGSNLAEALLAQGWVVRGLTRDVERCPLRSSAVRLIEGDLSQQEMLIAAMAGAEVVFHAAAVIDFGSGRFDESYAVNVTGTRNVLAAALRAKVKRVVFLSAASVLGYVTTPEEQADEKRQWEVGKENSYTYTKKCAEKVVQEYVQKGLDASIATITTVYGAGDRKMNSGTLVKGVYAGSLTCIPAGGTSFVGMSDLLHGLELIAQKGKAGQRYILCTQNLTFVELCNRIASALGVKPVRRVIPRWTRKPLCLALAGKQLVSRPKKGSLNLLTPAMVKETYFYKYYDSTQARQELGWEPKQSLEDAVKEAVAFYRKEGLL